MEAFLFALFLSLLFLYASHEEVRHHDEQQRKAEWRIAWHYQEALERVGRSLEPFVTAIAKTGIAAAEAGKALSVLLQTTGKEWHEDYTSTSSGDGTVRRSYKDRVLVSIRKAWRWFLD